MDFTVYLLTYFSALFCDTLTNCIYLPQVGSTIIGALNLVSPENQLLTCISRRCLPVAYLGPMPIHPVLPTLRALSSGGRRDPGTRRQLLVSLDRGTYKSPLSLGGAGGHCSVSSNVVSILTWGQPQHCQFFLIVGGHERELEKTRSASYFSPLVTVSFCGS